MSVKLNHLLNKANKALEKKDHASAGAIFEETVTLAPQSHQGWFGLGEVALGIGQTETAMAFLEHAVELQPNNPRYRQRLGETLGKLGQTDNGLKELLLARRLAPRDSDILCALAGGYVKTGAWQQAKAILKEVLRMPHPLGAHFCLLGLACQHLGEFDEALRAFGRATALSPRFPDSWLSLGHLHLHRGALDEADSALSRLMELAPETPTTQELAGEIAFARGNMREAANFFRKAAESAPDSVEYPVKLAASLVIAGDALAAIDAMEHAHQLGAPDDWILEQLGLVFTMKYWSPMARESLEMAVERNPNNLKAWNILLNNYVKSGNSEKIRAATDAILARDPDNINAQMNLATWYNDQGRHDDALEILMRCIQRYPNNWHIYSKALWAGLSSSSVHNADILALVGQLDQHLNQSHPEGPRTDFRARSLETGRKLRVGWLSSDLRLHPVSAFIEPFFGHFNPDEIDNIVYYNFSEEDGISRNIKAGATLWRAVADIGDETLRALIDNDQIDILVDLNGYTDGARLGIVAARAAPIQVSWLGFPGTSGIQAMDYLFIPPDPVLETGDWCTETPWPLPDCYGARANISNVPVTPGLPSERSDAPFTFANLNHFRKASEAVVELWSRILVAVPNARLVLVALGGKDDATIKSFHARFQRYGARPEQVEFRGYLPRDAYYDSYNDVDLGLDPFPFNGGTTGYDSIWMGVPFVTLPGEHLAARMGKAILENVGLRELVARNADEYVDIAVALATHPERLKALRKDLRERMLKSPLMDGPRMARSLTGAFRGMWARWVEKAQDGNMLKRNTLNNADL